MIESEYLKDNIRYVDILRKMPTFQSFTKEDVKGLLGLSKVRRYDAGEVILEEGFFDCWIYFLISGSVRVSKQGEEVSVLRRSGDIFGEMGVIDGSPRSASVYAVDETVCLATDASYIDRLHGNDRVAFCYVLYRIFSEILADRLRLTTEELMKEKEEIKRLRKAGNR